jgi:type I restriction enzyme S subunit
MQQLLTGKKRFKEFSTPWKDGQLNDFLEKIYGGGTPPRNNPAYWNGGIPWISVKDLVSNNISGAKEYITQAGVDESSANLVPKGVVIIATRMALGKAVRASRDVAINQDLKAIIPNKLLTPEYLHFWFLNISTELEKLGTGSTVKGLQLNDIKSLKMSLPDTIAEQTKITKALWLATNKVETLKSELACLNIQKKALMQQLLTGKRRFKVNTSEAMSA